MKNVLGIAHPDPDLGRAWPDQVAPRDPYAGDEALPMSGHYTDYLRHAERTGVSAPVSEQEYGVLDALFEVKYRAILDGDDPWSAIQPVAEALLVWGEVRHDSRPLPQVEHRVSDFALADMAENQLPQVGLVAPDRVLGPWADAPISRGVRVRAAAVMAFAPEVPPGVPAWARSCTRKPRLPAPVRQSLRSMARVPPMLWRIEDGGRLVNHLPFSRRAIPDAPIEGLPPCPAVIARVLPMSAGWELSCALPLPRLPAADVIQRRLDLELLRLRRRERRLTWEDLLRERGEVLYRSCCEWLWLQLSDMDTVPPW